MRKHQVAVLAGDGVGPEVTAQALRVLQAAGARFGFTLGVREGLIGAAAVAEAGRVLPAETLRHSREADAVLVGPIVGDRQLPLNDLRHPKQGLIKLRTWLGSYATVRPIRTYGCLERVSPLDPARGHLDVVVVYDHSSGLFYGRPHGIEPTDAGARATNTMVYTTAEVARTTRMAFEVAARRGGRVLSVDMAKLLETGRLWADTVAEVAEAYPDIALSRRDAQHFFYEFVGAPASYDVVLSEMSLGHLIAAMATGLTGTFALHPAAYLGGDVPLFQPSHGAAPDLAGAGRADPLGMIRAAAMMLAWGLAEAEASEAIEGAVADMLASGHWPAEIAPDRPELGAICGDRDQVHRLSTAEVGDEVIARLAGVRTPTAQPLRGT